jgi:hypothetical protein
MLRTFFRHRPARAGLAKTLTGGALALSLALTGITATATPAAANGHRNNQGAEAAAIFGGLLLLYGLSQAGRNTPRPAPHYPPVTRPLGGQPVQVIPHHPRPPQPNYRIAPGYCFVEGGNHGNRFRGYDARCMQQNVAAAHLLPGHCLRDVYDNHGYRLIYGGRCLSDAGWSRG